MTREIYTPDQFQPVPGYRDLTPQVISHSTCQIIDIFYSGIGDNLEPGRHFLATGTLPYLREAEQGFFATFDKKRHTTKVDTRRLTERGHEVTLQSINPEANEAFGFLLVVFAHLHEFTDQDFYVRGFSSRSTLACPQTSAEYMDRIHELQVSIAKLAIGQAKRDPKELQCSFGMVRTYAFFKVGDELMQKFTEKQLQAERKTATQETIQRFTADIPGLESF